MIFQYFKEQRRRKLRAKEFPDHWREILKSNFPTYTKLSAVDRKELEGHMHVFLAEKHFEGCGGLDLTEESRVTIAAAACVLLLHRKTDYYPELKTILVYPDTFVHKRTRIEGAVQHEDEAPVFGLAWSIGTVVLAWDSIIGGTRNIFDGRNVAFHEFAHLLDQEDGLMDGLPDLAPAGGRRERNARYNSWARICAEEYKSLRENSLKGKRCVIDDYGATDPAEFFAVVTECFFEKPRQLRKEHPQLYDELKEFYQQDPEKWIEADALRSAASESNKQNL